MVLCGMSSSLHAVSSGMTLAHKTDAKAPVGERTPTEHGLIVINGIHSFIRMRRLKSRKGPVISSEYMPIHVTGNSGSNEPFLGKNVHFPSPLF
jgi:hypothetical protein